MNKRIAPLLPLYVEAGPIRIDLFEDGTATVSRGALTVAVEISDAYDRLAATLRALVVWQPWIKKARKATLEYLVKSPGLAAGGSDMSQAVVSQLRNAGLLSDSGLWGYKLDEVCHLMHRWCKVELEHRAAREKRPKAADASPSGRTAVLDELVAALGGEGEHG